MYKFEYIWIINFVCMFVRFYFYLLFWIKFSEIFKTKKQTYPKHPNGISFTWPIGVMDFVLTNHVFISCYNPDSANASLNKLGTTTFKNVLIIWYMCKKAHISA